VEPHRAATSLSDAPVAQAGMIRHRRALPHLLVRVGSWAGVRVKPLVRAVLLRGVAGMVASMTAYREADAA
jgi:hypothetical protein